MNDLALELDCFWTVTDEMVLSGASCDGCEGGFVVGDRAASMVERIRHIGFFIHLTCEQRLLERLKGDWNA